jgi:hypothetical protein
MEWPVFLSQAMKGCRVTPMFRILILKDAYAAQGSTMNFETLTQPTRDTKQGLELLRRVASIFFAPCCRNSLYYSHLASEEEGSK